MSYIGIDLHPNNIVICKMEADQQITSRATYPVSPEGIAEFKKTLTPEDEIAVEATTNSTWFCHQVREHVARVVVVNTRAFKLITKSMKKTDKNDAKLLAYCLLKDMLPACRDKTQDQEDLKALTMARDQHVRARTTCINKITDLHVRNAIAVEGSLKSKKNLEMLDLSSVNKSHQIILDSMRKEIIHLNGLIRDLDNAIEDLADKQKGFDGLTSISGVGPNTAAVVLSTVGDIKDFPNKKTLSSYIGLVPGIMQSGSTIRYGRITKRGCLLTRKALVQCVFQVIKSSPEFAEFYYQLKRRRGSGRAIIATARKLLEEMYDVLKTGKVYTNFAKKEYIYPA